MQAAHQFASVIDDQVRFEIERLQQLAVKFSRVGAVWREEIPIRSCAPLPEPTKCLGSRTDLA